MFDSCHPRTKSRAKLGILLIMLTVAFGWGAATDAQQNSNTPQQTVASAVPPQEETEQNSAIPCVQPPPMVSWQDYQGPLEKAVGVFARRLERKSVHPPHYKPGVFLCSLSLQEKFILFAEDTFDPVTFLSTGFNAGLDQAQNTDKKFGQGAEGYGKRFGADFVDQASSEFFKDVMYSTIFQEDPRYYRMAHGGGKARFFHALEHSFVARRESGADMFNFSEWLGTTSAVALADVYHPGAKQGVGPAAERVSISIAQDAGFNVLREFWPEIARKFKLPFRDQQEPQNPSPPRPY
jgi:hypothetical protein